MHEKIYEGGVERLRAPERVARLEVERVVSICLEGVELKSVLDVGVGSGLFAEEFSKRGLEVAGVDVNPEMIVETRVAKARADAGAHAAAQPFLDAVAGPDPTPGGGSVSAFAGAVPQHDDQTLVVVKAS